MSTYSLGMDYQFNSSFVGAAPQTLQCPTFGSSLSTHSFHVIPALMPMTSLTASSSFHPSPSFSANLGEATVVKTNDLMAHVTDQKKLGLLLSAYEKGKAMHETRKAGDEAIAAGADPVETRVCLLAGFMAKETTDAVASGLVLGGLGTYLMAAVEFPPLAATIPGVGAILPDTFAGIDLTSHAAGAAAESICHSAFDLAKQQALNGGNYGH